MLIVITGTPGTGKTSVSSLLAKKFGAGVSVIHISEFVKAKRLAGGYDAEMKSGIVDSRKLGRALKAEIAKMGGERGKADTGAAGKKGKRENILIVEGHLACEISLPADYVFVLRCRPGLLSARMESRGYGKLKIRENLLAEMLDYCTVNAMANYAGSKVIELETADSAASGTAEKIRKVVSSGGRGGLRGAQISYGKELKQFLGLGKQGVAKKKKG